MVNERNSLRDKVTGLESKAGEYTTQLADWEQKYTTLQAQSQTDVGLASLGLTDPNARDLATFLWNKQAEDARGGSPVEWVNGQLQEGGSIHPGLMGYLGGASSSTTQAKAETQAPATTTTQAQAPATTQAAGVAAGTNGGAAAGPRWDQARGLNGMSLEEYRKERTEVLGTKL